MKYLNGFILIGIILFFISIAGFVYGNTILTEPGLPVNNRASLEYLGAAILMLINGAVSVWNANRKEQEQQAAKKASAQKESAAGATQAAEGK
jgi:cytochrome c-type biogenesis protein CcmH/NrfF